MPGPQLDPIVKLMLERQMASHQKSDPNAPGADTPIVNPYTEPNYGGGLDSLVDRFKQREGLPGATPYIDPRLVNPNNSALMSEEGMQRGDFYLPSERGVFKHISYPSQENPNNARALKALTYYLYNQMENKRK